MSKSMIEIIQHDPNGLIRNDIAHLKSIFKEQRYSPGTSMDKIMFEQGQLSIIDYIEREMVAKRP